MSNIRLVMQNNLISENDLGQIQQVCREVGIECQEILVTPFSTELPEFTYSSNNIYYGSTTLMNNIYDTFKRPKGLFYDHKIFSMEKYIFNWGGHMLSEGAIFMSVGEFINNDRTDPEVNLFVRPDGDGKEFDGQVGKEYEIMDMLERMLKYESSITEYTKILVAPAYNIVKEWRNYVVGGEIVTSSKYRQNFKLNKSGLDIPESMLEFTRDRISEFKPHENFAIDIAQMDDGSYYIIECGCLNSVGFYHCDINKLFKAIIEWMKK